MRYGIISDIHGNLEAFLAVLEDCEKNGVRQHYCIGDIVGYGSNPEECISLIQENNSPCVAGNHDWAVSGKIEITNFNPVAKEAVSWTEKVLMKEHSDYLSNLELVFKHQDFIMVHGTLNQPEEFHYLTDIREAADTFYLMDRSICFIGHTHVPQIYHLENENVSYVKTDYAEINKQSRYIVNIGSVGQPRDGNPDASYCIYDPDLERIEIKRVPYDVKTAQKKIIEAGLPDFLAQRLALGQ